MIEKMYLLKSKIKKGTFVWRILSRTYRVFKKIKKLSGITDYSQEIDYWDNWSAKNSKLLYSSEIRYKMFPKQLMKYIDALSEGGTKNIKLLEIGSGPLSLLTHITGKSFCKITAVDPLASVYEEVYKKYNMCLPIKPIKGFGENLVRMFGRDIFDIAYCSNTLDHVTSPQRCFKNMYEAIKKEGIIFIEGYISGGMRNNYDGLHRYDLFTINKQLFLSYKGRRPLNLIKELNLKCIYEETCSARERLYGTPFFNYNAKWLIIVFKKTR